MNAWESDFADDPLLPMLSVLDAWLGEQSSMPAVHAAWEKAKSFAPGIIKSTAVALAKAATLGALDIDKELEKIAADVAGGAVGDLVDSFNAKKRSLELFKENLSASLAALPEHQGNLIIFIDELDRCRPTYSVELLERIKHLFDVDQIVFVLAINRNQLGKSIQGVYGASFDGFNYLRRFIDMDYRLATPDVASYVEKRMHHKDIVDYMSDRQGGRDELRSGAQVLAALVERFSYSLRDIDQLVMRFKLVLRSVERQQYLDLDLMLCLLVLRTEGPELYGAYVSGTASASQVISYLIDGEPGKQLISNDQASIVCAFIENERVNRRGGDIGDLLEPWRSATVESGLEELVDIAHYIISRSKNRQDHMRRGNPKKTAYERIELVAGLNLN